MFLSLDLRFYQPFRNRLSKHWMIPLLLFFNSDRPQNGKKKWAFSRSNGFVLHGYAVRGQLALNQDCLICICNAENKFWACLLGGWLKNPEYYFTRADNVRSGNGAPSHHSRAGKICVMFFPKRHQWKEGLNQPCLPLRLYGSILPTKWITTSTCSKRGSESACKNGFAFKIGIGRVAIYCIPSVSLSIIVETTASHCTSDRSGYSSSREISIDRGCKSHMSVYI